MCRAIAHEDYIAITAISPLPCHYAGFLIPIEEGHYYIDCFAIFHFLIISLLACHYFAIIALRHYGQRQPLSRCRRYYADYFLFGFDFIFTPSPRFHFFGRFSSAILLRQFSFRRLRHYTPIFSSAHFSVCCHGVFSSSSSSLLLIDYFRYFNISSLAFIEITFDIFAFITVSFSHIFN